MYLKKINLKNKVALVTGAGKGIGRACSIALAEAGATIIGVSRTTSDLDKLQKDIKKVKGKLTKITCDIMNYEDLSSKLKKIKKVDILVNNAGTNIPEPFEKIKQTSMNYLVDLNMKAAFNVAQLVVIKMNGNAEENVKKVDSSSFMKAITTVILADVTMSLDNVLGVAGAARDHYMLLIFGLVLSIVLMATAATLISGWIKKYKWIGWVGLLAILFVAIELIYTDVKLFL